MEINKVLIGIITIISFIIVIFLDIINISQYFDYTANIDNTISNVITFVSILIGFISTIYVMIQQSENSYVLKLLKEFKVTNIFNNSFKLLIYIGFLDVIVLIALNFFCSNITVFKYIFYVAFPLNVYFLLLSNNIITTICKIIISEEKLKNKNKKIEENDLK
jgi:hypothetical protein